MKPSYTLAVGLALCASLVTAAMAAAESFEGTLKMRSIAVASNRLSDLVSGKPDPDKVFAVPLDRLLALKGSGVRIQETTIDVKNSKVRANGVGREAEGYAIMDLDQGTTWMVMPKEKKYVEWTKADMQALSEKVSAMQKTMQEHMANMPPEQRQQMEAMMKGMKGMPGMPGAPAAAPKVEIKPLGKSRTINGMQTTAYEVRAGDETSIGWVTSDHPELIQTFKAFRQNEQKMMPGIQRQERSIRAQLAEHGLPVLVQTLAGGSYHVEELVDVQKKPLAADLFSVPAGFQKSTPQQMMGGPGHGRPHP